MLRSEISAAALAMVGTPFHAQGRLPGVGLDCIGVVVCVARQLGIPHSDLTAYPMRPNGMLQPLLDAQLVRVRREPQEGDVLLMSFEGEPHHVAVMINGGRIVHSYNAKGVRKCVVQSYTDHWRSKVRAVYEFPGVE
jgi:cell wall-associated NlpC family hydrolase